MEINKSYGSFQKMNLPKQVLKAILAKGYKVPTPIQKKLLPAIFEKHDVVANSRTGSGKTAAFLIPIISQLLNHSVIGARALILSPTRDLAIQTLKFFKELSKNTDLTCALIVGGDSIETHFKLIHNCPDIIIGTPGRILHLLIEMSLKLQHLELMVFDESDRLFELGFSESLHELLKYIPEKRQTILISATLPTSVIQFSKAGLHNPKLIRLDSEYQLNPNLKMTFLFCKTAEEKLALLLFFLTEYISNQQKTILFVATKYHVEYFKEIIDFTDIKASVSYSSMDDEARKISLQQFIKGETSLLITTDIAARGLDIPFLDNVINFNFPTCPKIFVHRVGRVARMNRSGCGFCFFTSEEFPYVIDLHIFLLKDLKLCEDVENNDSQREDDYLIGSVPSSVILEYQNIIQTLHQSNIQFNMMKKSISQALKKVKKFDKEASKCAMDRSKEVDLTHLGYHPMFKYNESDIISKKLLFSHHNRSKFQITGELQKVFLAGEKINDIVQKTKIQTKYSKNRNIHKNIGSLLDNVSITEKKSSKLVDPNFEKLKHGPSSGKDEFLSFFESSANKNSLEMLADETENLKKVGKREWDPKKKKYVNKNNSKQLITTEFGARVSKTFKSDKYKKWLNKNPLTNPGINSKSIRENPVGNNKEIKTSNQLLKKRLKRKVINKKRTKRR